MLWDVTVSKPEHSENNPQSKCGRNTLSFQLLHIVLFLNLNPVLALLVFTGGICYGPIQLAEQLFVVTHAIVLFSLKASKIQASFYCS